jgi:hypothetical protein
MGSTSCALPGGGTHLARQQAMDLNCGNYYHLFNRSNNNEIVFKEKENYRYFLEKYSRNLGDFVY